MTASEWAAKLQIGMGPLLHDEAMEIVADLEAAEVARKNIEEAWLRGELPLGIPCKVLDDALARAEKAEAARAALAAALRKAYEPGVRELARKAAEGGEAAADELMTEFISKKRAANWGIINEGLLACGALIRALSSPSLPADVAELLAAVEGRKEEKDE